MKQWSRLAAFTVVLVLAACSDQSGPTIPAPEPRATGQIVTCQVAVQARNMNCDGDLGPASEGLSLAIIGGPQGKYVRMQNDAPTYVGTTFSAAVRLSNRTVQPMGTVNGSTVDTAAIKVFFSTPPTVTSGTGVVTVANADGIGTFLTAGQQYFKYNQMLGTDTSVYTANKTWQFNVPVTVNHFTFAVRVAARFPADSGILLLDSVNIGTTADLSGVSGHNGRLWAVGAAGTIRYFAPGAAWVAQSSGHPTVPLRGIDMYGAGTAGSERGIAVGDSGLILRYNGSTWSTVIQVGNASLLSVQRVQFSEGSGSGQHWIACGGGGVIAYTRDSTGATGWAQETSSSGKDFHFCGGPDTSSVYAVGQDGVVEHTGGGVHVWTTAGYTSGTTQTLFAVTGTNNGIFFGGQGGTIVRVPFPPGTTGAPFTSPTANTLYGGNNDISAYFVGAAGTVLVMNDTATTWLTLRTPTTQTLNGVAVSRLCPPTGSCAGLETEHIWAVGNGGLLLHGHR